MAVFKVKKNKNYTTMSNYHLQNKNLSLKAKGLLSYMLSLPNDWDYSISGLVANCRESKTSIRTALNELKEHGYLVIEKLYPNQTKSKKIEYSYNIYEEPKIKTLSKKQDTENLYLDFQEVENNTQQNTNIQKDKIDKTKNNIFEDNHNFLTLDLIKRKYISKEDTDIYNYDRLFHQLLNNYNKEDIVTILHYIIPRVLERHFLDENGNKIENKFGYLKKSIENNIDRFKSDDKLWEQELEDYEINNI